MLLARAGALGQAAPMARGLAQISRVNNASEAAPGFCSKTLTKRFISYLIVEPAGQWRRNDHGRALSFISEAVIRGAKGGGGERE
jgi:hypothetical protein